MGFVAAKCTQCGANIEVDDDKEAGICEYCGTAFITEKVINNYNTYVTNNNNFAGATINIIKSDIEGLLQLAKKELLVHNYSNANFYLDEIKKSSGDSQQRISDLFDELRILEQAKAAWNKDIESKETKELMNEIIKYDSQNVNVWLFMMETAFYPPDIISYGNKVLALASQEMKIYYMEKVYEMYILKEFAPNTAVSKVNLVSEIPYDFIIQNDKLQSLLMENCSRFITKNRSIIISYQSRIDAWCKQLQSDKREEIQRMLKECKGCYIATCVYGSYDCPQVWTLRRYRDYILDKTWYGRAFIKYYYAISPVLVKWFGQATWFRRFWKFKLDKMVAKLNMKGIDDTNYKDKY